MKPNLLELASPLGEENDLVIERLPRAGLVAKLDDVDDCLPRAGDISGQSHLLLDIEERLYRRIEVGTVALLHPFVKSRVRARDRNPRRGARHAGRPAETAGEKGWSAERRQGDGWRVRSGEQALTMVGRDRWRRRRRRRRGDLRAKLLSFT